MCIRDRAKEEGFDPDINADKRAKLAKLLRFKAQASLNKACLLYTSDAADERSSVDLGGRRIIKKKKKKETKGERTR